MAAAQREAASPVAEALGGLKTMADVLERDDTPETRTAARSEMRRVVAGIDVWLRRRGWTQLAFATVRFVCGGVRAYVILKTKTTWHARSFTAEGFELTLNRDDLPDDFAARMRRYATGIDGEWRCPKCRWHADVGDAAWSDDGIPQGFRICPKCGTGRPQPVVPANVTTGEIP